MTPRRATLTELVDRSHIEHARSYDGVDDDSVAWGRFATEATDIAGAPHAVVCECWWMGRWRADRYPRVVLGPRRAASLMATGVAAEQMSMVVPPWRAFLVEIADSPVVIRDPHAPDGSAPIDRLEVQYSMHHDGQPGWTMLASTAFGTGVQRYNVFSPDWINDALVYEGPADAFSLACDAEDLRALSVLSRLVAGLSLSLATPEALADAVRRAKGKSYRARRRGPSVLRDYVLGDDVRVDVREAVRDYVTRGGRAPRVQHLVRGHWRTQPHGPERALRKWIHVEPYWRGPESERLG
ncbi:MAG: hypothetical protein KF850_33155 [Labilithrix sp.]|nr:hypothetical protein [Labilithrix sp.]